MPLSLWQAAVFKNRLAAAASKAVQQLKGARAGRYRDQASALINPEKTSALPVEPEAFEKQDAIRSVSPAIFAASVFLSSDAP